jgi:hypothetical protein
MKPLNETVRVGTKDNPLAYEDWQALCRGTIGAEVLEGWGEAWFRSYFEIVRFEGTPMMALEAEILDVGSMLDAFEGETPLLVDKDTWQAAVGLDPDAIVKANTMQPSCIYCRPEIVEWIERTTRTAVCALDEKERESARDQLERALLPRQRYQQSGTPFSLLPNRLAYRNCYRDVVAMRLASKRLEGKDLFLAYPEAESWPAKWLNAVRFKSKGKAASQVDAAGIILRDVLKANGQAVYEPNSFRKVDPEWSSESVSQIQRRSGKLRSNLRLNLVGAKQ